MIRILLFSILLSLGFIALAQKPATNPIGNSSAPTAGANQPAGQPQQAQNPGKGVTPDTPPQGEDTARDPFKGPQYLINKIRAATLASNPPPVRGIDDRVDAIIRWPLVEYNLVGIMWDVKNPKALVRDPANKIHVLKVHDKYSSDEAQIKRIREGTLMVEVRGVEQIIRLKKK